MKTDRFKSRTLRRSMMMAVCACGWLTAQNLPSLTPNFTHARQIQVNAQGKQNYFVVDEAVWEHARHDLGDIRIFQPSGREAPYALRIQRIPRVAENVSVPLLNKGDIHGDTQFTADIQVPEYDQLVLELSTKDYVARATVEGANELSGGAWNNLGAYLLYDFSKEKLGSNATIHLSAPSRYRYLRVTISGPVSPDEVSAASVANVQEAKTRFVSLSMTPRVYPRGNHTVAEWDASDRVPLERVEVEIDPSEINFARQASLFCDDKSAFSRGDQLSRVRLVRKDRKIEYESLSLETDGLRCKKYRLEIFNGDDPPLNIKSVKPMMVERRVYFDARGETNLQLYYGDDRLSAPVYDFAKFFDSPDDDKIAKAQLAAETRNAAYTGRPDDRPFTERYPAVMWVAMLLAVGLLGAWAFKGFKS